MTKYIELVKRALLNVEQRYYSIPVIYSQTQINRERVFCYELYHQMRNEMDSQINDEMDLSLHAEIDKSGNPSFSKQNPDFVFHKPGTNEFNELICEVKGSLDWKGIRKDFKTILTLMTVNNYNSGIFILYNYELRALFDRRNGIRSAAMLIPESGREIVLSKVIVLAMPYAGHGIEYISLREMLLVSNI